MAEITTTQAFSDGDTVTATKLNNITANAAIQTEAITNRSAETTVDQANDLLLMYDASATALKKISLSNVIKAGTASNFPVTGNATIGGTLGVTGASTLSGNTTVGGTLGVTGAITASSTVNGTTIPTSKTLVTTDDTQTLTGKTVNLSGNTLSGTLAQFNTACSDADFASLAGSETLTNKTLTSPAINTGTISGGTINNAVIGGTTAAAGSFTTLSATSPITTQAGTAAAPAIVPTGDTNTGAFFPAADTVAISTNGTERVRVDSSGNVGIGTTSLYSGTGVTSLNIGATSYPFIDLKSGPNTSRTQISFDGTNSIINSLSGSLALHTGSSERLRIDSSGNVGIGESSIVSSDWASGTTVLQVNNSTGWGAIKLTGNNAGKLYLVGGTNHYVWGYSNSPLIFGTNDTERLRITSGGEVYIAGTTDQGAYNLQVNGTGVWGAGAYVNGSDERLKENIQDITSGLDVVEKLRPVSFQYKEDYTADRSVQSGFIAQDLLVALEGKNYLEGVVSQGPTYYNVAYQNLIPILAKAIQELKAENDSLKTRIAALEAV